MGWPFGGYDQKKIGVTGGTRHSMSRHTFSVATWVGLRGVTTHFWCRDMMLAALWPFGVATKALGHDRGRLPGRVATSAQRTCDREAVCAAAQPPARQRAMHARQHTTGS